MSSENTQSLKVLDELMQSLSISKDESSTKQAAANLASFMNGRMDMDVPTK
jgi:hypothetical protein